MLAGPLSLPTFAAKLEEYKKMKADAKTKKMVAATPGGMPNDHQVDPEAEKLATALLTTWIVLFVICLILWVWHLVVLIKYWDDLPSVAQVFGIIAVFTGMSPISLIVIYATKGSKKAHTYEDRLSFRSRHH